MKTRSTSRLNYQQEKNIPNVRKALRAGPRTRSEARVLLTFQKSSSESSDLVSEKVVKNTFKTPERDGILPDFSDTEKLSQTTTITHKQIEENSQSLKDYGTLPDNSVLGFTKPADSFWWKHLDESFQPSFQQSGEGILLGKDSHLGDSTIKNMSPVWYKHISSSLLATPVVRRADGTVKNSSANIRALQNTSNSPNDVVIDLQFRKSYDTSTKHLSGSDISGDDISLEASSPTKLFKGRKAKTLVHKDLFQEALHNTKNSPNDAVNDLQSITPEPSAKHLSGSDISDEDISVKASRPTKLFKGRKAKTLVNKDLFQKALHNTTNSPNDAVNDLESITPEPSAKHLSSSDITDEDIPLKASRPPKLFKGRKVKRLVNKDLFQEALQNTKNSPNDAVNDLKSITPEPSAKHLSGSDISDEDISVKASRPTKLFKGRKVKTLVHKDLFQEALNNTSNSPNDAVTVQQSIIPEPSAKHLSDSDISDEDNSLKASRPKKLFKGKKTQTLANKDLFQKALHNNTKSFDDTIKNWSDNPEGEEGVEVTHCSADCL
uniref:Uncharacterized protein n=1 Tax=Timema cristinae TaxID=61476 RepID=A0A7R9D5I1_TIMCR|nr:unnamed protein product [Timema cristinae]